ncbi:hypothetical protein [Natrinema sp. 1APR25-10V2]|uniref:hypothetical protein n=1 Tax=Natrinema sp. 1APR25-10V2 TaxID=2951081 RepID=UPI002874C1FB|nr:hypothetical protein [Natrinema sp. 1APR25-10V2]MDS0477326.1 hypothetical protein [Natrinema sp. 1APR25-10V2]
MPETELGDSLELADGERTVRIQKLWTPTGERLLVNGSSDEIRLDALALESLTWQDDSFFSKLTNEPHAVGEDVAAVSDKLDLSNEYTVIRVEKTETTAGSRVTVESPKLGYSCQLSPAELDVITQKQIEFFSKLLETPYGPEDDHHHGGH